MAIEKIDKLTPEQEALIPVVRDRFLELALNSGDEVDIEAMTKGINWLYEQSGQKPPEIILADSPVHAQRIVKEKKALLGLPDTGYEPFAYIGIGYDAHWVALYQFFTECGIVNHPDFNLYHEFILAGIWDMITMDILCVPYRRAQKIYRDDQDRLHSDQYPAIQWRDGVKFYYLDGNHLEQEMWEAITSKRMSFENIMRIDNADIRALALKYNPEAMLSAGAELIHTGAQRGDKVPNELYKVVGTSLNTFLDEPELYFMKMVCETGRVFVEGVNPEVAKANPNADYCQATALKLTLEEYLALTVEG